MSNISGKKTIKAFILLIDVGLVVLSYVLAFYLRYDQIDARNWESFVSLVPWIALLAFFLLSIYDLYTTYRKTIWDLIRNLFVSMTLLAFMTMALSFLFREFALPRSVILIAYFVSIILLSLWKALFVFLGQKHEKTKILLIAEDDDAAKLIAQIKITEKKSKISRIHPHTDMSRMMSMIDQHDSIMLSSNMDQELKSEILYHAMKMNKLIYVVPSLYDLLLSKSAITSLDDMMVMAVKPFGLTVEERFMKRIFDISLSFVGLILLIPVMMLIALAIKIENPRGSIFYLQKRIGYNNKTFTIYKFRSMIEGAEENTGPTLASAKDPRITKVGYFLRLTRLDEIPQVLNVLKGDMSIVGPRPEREFFTRILNQQYQSYQYRNKVKPGITGYAQIMGKYTTGVRDKLMFDLYYIRNYSFWLDMVIILRTFVVILDHKKSEGKQLGKKKSTQVEVNSPL